MPFGGRRGSRARRGGCSCVRVGILLTLLRQTPFHRFLVAFSVRPASFGSKYGGGRVQ
jgi:hypothetical protein